MKQTICIFVCIMSLLVMLNDYKELNPTYTDIVGVWDQYLYYKKDGKLDWQYYRTIQVTKVKDEYKLVTLLKSNNSSQVTSVLESNVKFDGKSWLFYTYFDDCSWGILILEMVTPSMFEGYTYAVDDKMKPAVPIAFNLMIRHEL